jgi:Fe-S-cluster containining protein
MSDETFVMRTVLQQFFECKRCGQCCIISNIAIYESEIENMRKGLNLSKKTFMKKYLQKERKISPEGLYYYLFRKPCKLFDIKRGCTIHDLIPDIRPAICKIHPFVSFYKEGETAIPWFWNEGDCIGLEDIPKFETPKEWVIAKIKKLYPGEDPEYILEEATAQAWELLRRIKERENGSGQNNIN